MSVDNSVFVNSDRGREDYSSDSTAADLDAAALDEMGEEFGAVADVLRSQDATIITNVPTSDIARVSKLDPKATGGKDARFVEMKNGDRFVVIKDLNEKAFALIDDAGAAIEAGLDIVPSIIDDGYDLKSGPGEYPGLAAMTDENGIISATFGDTGEKASNMVRFHWADVDGNLTKGMISTLLTLDENGAVVVPKVETDRELYVKALAVASESGGAGIVGDGYEMPSIEDVEAVEEVPGEKGLGDAVLLKLKDGDQKLILKSLNADAFEKAGEYADTKKAEKEEEARKEEEALRREEGLEKLEGEGYTLLDDNDFDFSFGDFMDKNGHRVGAFGNLDEPAPGLLSIWSDKADYKHVIDAEKTPDLYDRALKFRDNLIATEEHQKAGWSIWNAAKFKTGHSQLRDIERSSIDVEAGIIRVKFWDSADPERRASQGSDAWWGGGQHSGEWVVFSEMRTPEAYDVIRKYIYGPVDIPDTAEGWNGNNHSNAALNGWYADPRWTDYVPTNDLEINSVRDEDAEYDERLKDD